MLDSEPTIERGGDGLPQLIGFGLVAKTDVRRTIDFVVGN